jgi:hypothetical protein
MAGPTAPPVVRPDALQRGEGFIRLADRVHRAVDVALRPLNGAKQIAVRIRGSGARVIPPAG